MGVRRENASATCRRCREERKSSGIARICVLFAILVFCCREKGAAFDFTCHISQYGYSVWRVQDGCFGGATPTSITQTKDGYICVGTVAGLYRFDVVRFVRWSSSSGEELPSPLHAGRCFSDEELKAMSPTSAPSRIFAVDGQLLFRNRIGALLAHSPRSKP